MNSVQEISIEESNKTTEVKKNFRKAVANKIYSIYFELLKERTMSIEFAVVMIVITALQLIGYLHYKALEVSFNEDLFKKISSVISIFRIYPLLENTDNSTIYWALNFISFILVILYILQLIYVYYTIKAGTYFVFFSLIFLRNLSTLFFWILLSPIVELFVSSFRCSDGNHIIDTSLTCWSGLHIFYCTFFTLGLVLFVFIGFLISLLYNESRSVSTDGLARLDVNLEPYFFGYRVLVAILGVFISSTSASWVLLALHLIGSFYFLSLYVIRIPYYNPIISVTYGICMAAYFWISLIFCLLAVLNSSTCYEKTLVVGCVLSIPLIINLRDRYIHKLLLERRHDKLENSYELDIYLYKILDIIKNYPRSEKEKTLIIGFVLNHKSECSNADCPINADELYLPATGATFDKKEFDDPILVLYLLKEICNNYMRQPNFKASMNLSYSNLLFEHIGNLHAAIIELYKAEALVKDLQQAFSIYRNKRLMEEYLTSKYNKSTKSGDDMNKQSIQSLDVTVVIKFEDLCFRLIKQLERSTNVHTEFWGQLDSVVPDLNILHKLGLNITTYNMFIEKLWNKLIKINPTHIKALKHYGHYLKDIRNDEEMGSSYIEKYKALLNTESNGGNLNDFNLMFAEDTTIIIISGKNEESRGRILRTNSGLSILFKYNPSDVVGQDVSILMPSIIGNKHHYFMERYFATGKEKLINNERELYAMTRGGSLICISIIVKLVPSLADNIQYIGLIRARHKDDYFILTDAFGKINSISASLNGVFELQNTFFKENSVYIQFLFPDLLKIILNKDNTLTTAFDKLSGTTRLNCYSMENIWQAIEKFNKEAGYQDNEDPGRKNSSPKAKNVLGSSFLGSFVSVEGLKGQKLPPSVKKIAKLVYGKNYKNKITFDENFLFKKINYKGDGKRDIWDVEVKDLNFGDGYLKFKAFRLVKDKSNDRNSLDNLNEKRKASRRNVNNFEGVKAVKSFVSEHEKPHHSADNIPIKRKEQKDGSQIISYMDRQRTFSGVTRLSKRRPEQKQNVVTSTNELKYVSIDNSLEINILGPKSKNDNNESQHDQTVSLNMSRMDERPLMAGPNCASHIEEKDEDYLHKRYQNTNEQEEVIRSFLKFRGEIVPDIKEEGEKKEILKEYANGRPIELDSGSVNPGASSLIKTIRALKNAVYEDYCPSSIKQLACVARIVFILLMVISLIYYILALKLYENLSIGASSIHHNRDRLMYIVLSGSCTRALTLINPGSNDGVAILDLNVRNAEDHHLDGFEGENIEGYETMNYKEWIEYCLETSARKVKQIQNILSTTSFSFSKTDLELINPSSIIVEHKKEDHIADESKLDCWSVIMSLVIHSLKTRNLPLGEILVTNPSVYYVVQNSYNNIFYALSNSNEAIQEASKSTASKNRIILLILTIIASIALIVSVILILRVTIMTNNSKEDILKLFIDIPTANVKEQLEKCKGYFLIVRGTDKDEFAEQEFQMEEAEKEENSEEVKKNDETAKLMEDGEESGKKTRKSKQKKFKPYNTNICLFIIGFSFFTLLLEAYFLSMFLRSHYFLNMAVTYIKEMGILARHSLVMSYLYEILKEYVGSKGTATIMRISSEEYMVNRIGSFVNEYQSILDNHNDHSKIIPKKYKELFDNLVFQNLCEYMFTNSELEACNKYEILKKGMHTATISYWDHMREMFDYYQLRKDSEDRIELAKTILNNRITYTNERMRNKYFALVFNNLLHTLGDDTENKFKVENRSLLIAFILFIVGILLIYAFVWREFVESTRVSLWVTKCMLGIIPINMILDVKNIKDFLTSSSKGLMVNIGSN